MEQTECSETSAYKIQMPGNYPEENIQNTTVVRYTYKLTMWHESLLPLLECLINHSASI